MEKMTLIFVFCWHFWGAGWDKKWRKSARFKGLYKPFTQEKKFKYHLHVIGLYATQNQKDGR